MEIRKHGTLKVTDYKHTTAPLLTHAMLRACRIIVTLTY